MSRDADLLYDVVARLWRVRERLGPEVYRAAGRAALHAIAAAVLEEAERRAGLNRPSGVILRFRRGNRRGTRGHSR
jgi:hypothetical protein